MAKRPRSHREKLTGYLCWASMNMRCRTPNFVFYHRYGGRGITVCPEWQGKGGYERFIAHIGPRPSEKHQIDRIDNDGNYEPGNVRWALPEANSSNKGNNHRMTCRGETKTIAEWARQIGCSTQAIYSRLRLGCSDEEAILDSVDQVAARPEFGEPAKGSAISVLSTLEIGESVVIRCSRQRVQQIAVKLGMRFACVLQDMQNKCVKVTRISLDGSRSLAKVRARTSA